MDRVSISAQPLTQNQTKYRFEVLDGLRGVAAVAVLLGHASVLALGQSFVDRKLLAVHFFFMLSGFVIEYSYGSRLNSGMSLSKFITLRIVRLYPLIIVGAILGVLVVLKAVSDGGSYVSLAAAFVRAVLTIPKTDGSFWLNPPEWSLFFEMVFCLIYATVICRLNSTAGTFVLVLLLCISAWGMSEYTDHVPFAYHFADGTASFLYGVLLLRFWRSNVAPAPTLPFWALGGAVLAVCFAPRAWGAVIDILSICVIFPAIILSGAAHATTAKAARFEKFAGELSYPLYILHWPILVLIVSIPIATEKKGEILLFPGSCLCVVAAWLMLKYFDIPVRKYLAGKS